jgi:hypothetical protein
MPKTNTRKKVELNDGIDEVKWKLTFFDGDEIPRRCVCMCAFAFKVRTLGTGELVAPPVKAEIGHKVSRQSNEGTSRVAPN